MYYRKLNEGFEVLKSTNFLPLFLNAPIQSMVYIVAIAPMMTMMITGEVFWYCEKYSQAYGLLVRSKVLLQLYWFWEVTHTHTQLWLLTLETSVVFTYVPTLAKYVEVFHKKKEEEDLPQNSKHFTQKVDLLTVVSAARPSVQPVGKCGNLYECVCGI